MCEYNPACTMSNDPEALLLWTATGRQRASFLVRCPKEYHPIAAVFELPTRGPCLCLPPYSALHKSLFIDPERPDDLAHFHARLVEVAAYAEGETEQSRCKCGTWGFRPATMDPKKWGTKHGPQPYVLAGYVAMADSESARRHRESPESDGTDC